MFTSNLFLILLFWINAERMWILFKCEWRIFNFFIFGNKEDERRADSQAKWNECQSHGSRKKLSTWFIISRSQVAFPKQETNKSIKQNSNRVINKIIVDWFFFSHTYGILEADYCVQNECISFLFCFWISVNFDKCTFASIYWSNCPFSALTV